MAAPQFKAVLIATPQMRSKSGLTFRSKQSAVWPADPRGRRGGCAVSRICEKRGEHTQARNLCQQSIASFLPTETDRVARRSLARLAKRQGDFESACDLWKAALGNSRHGYNAYEQLAMYYEHKAREPEQARQIVQQALDELSHAIQVGDIAPGPYREIKARFDRRMERLKRKNGRPLLAALMTQAQA